METFHLVSPTDTIVSFSLLIAISLALTPIVTISQGPHQEIYWLPIGHEACADKPLSGYTLDMGYVIICPTSLPPNENPTVGDRDIDHEQGTVDIDDMAEAVSTVLFHEFLHALFPHSKCILWASSFSCRSFARLTFVFM